MPTETPTRTPAPLEVAADLDGIGLFLADLAETPMFEHHADALQRFTGAAWKARTEFEERHGLDAVEVETLQEERMRESGLYDEHHRLTYAARDIALLDEKIRKLADLIDADLYWDATQRAWLQRN